MKDQKILSVDEVWLPIFLLRLDLVQIFIVNIAVACLMHALFVNRLKKSHKPYMNMLLKIEGRSFTFQGAQRTCSYVKKHAISWLFSATMLKSYIKC